jgi:hypothetical protein
MLFVHCSYSTDACCISSDGIEAVPDAVSESDSDLKALAGSKLVRRAEVPVPEPPLLGDPVFMKPIIEYKLKVVIAPRVPLFIQKHFT